MTDPIDNTTYMTAEPSSDSDTGLNGGFGSQYGDYNEYKVYNGAFRQGPPEPSANLDPSNSVSGSNFMPNWPFIQSSNTNITAKQTRNTAYPSGSNTRFTFAAGAAADEAIQEQIVDIGGDQRGDFPDHVRTQAVAGAGNTGTFGVGLRLQYLTADYTIVGMPGEQISVGTVAAGATLTLETDATNTGIAPTNAKYLRIRFGVARSGAANGAIGTVDFPTIRRTRGVSKQVFTTAGAATWRKPAGAQWVQATVIGAGGGGGSGRRGAAGTIRNGGGGGGGGAASTAIYAASELTDTVAVTVGAGGAGGPFAAADNTNGTLGATGGTSSFGSYIRAGGGFGGGGGDNSAGGSAGGPPGTGMFAGAQGGGSGGAVSDAVDGPVTGAGGGGATIDATNAAAGGTNGSVPIALFGIITRPLGGTGGNSGGAGADPTAGAIGGTGSGGGGTNGSGTNPAGGRGAGGGGGGGRLNGGNGKTGGDGGPGYVAVIAW